MSQLAVHRPLDERDLHDDLGLYPVRAPRQSLGSGERRRRHLDAIEARSQIAQQLRVESRTDFAGEGEIVTVEVPDQQRAEADAGALWIGEAADDQLLGGLALHLEPV